jgi:hypothetical protein
MAATTIHPRSFRIVTPVIRKSAAELTAIMVLTAAALSVWLLVLPLEIVLG